MNAMAVERCRKKVMPVPMISLRDPSRLIWFAAMTLIMIGVLLFLTGRWRKENCE